MADVRTFFAMKASKPESKPTLGTNAWGDPCMYCLRKQGGRMVIGVGYGTCADCSTAQKQAQENPGEPPLGTEFVFEPTLRSLIMSDKVMEADEEDGFRHWTREPTEEEWDTILVERESIRLPYNWGWDYPMVDGKRVKFYEIHEVWLPRKDWDKRKGWTMRQVVTTLRTFYGKNKYRNLRSLGDHTFVEGFLNDGTLCLGS